MLGLVASSLWRTMCALISDHSPTILTSWVELKGWDMIPRTGEGAANEEVGKLVKRPKIARKGVIILEYIFF